MKSLDYLSSIHTEKTTFAFRFLRLTVQKDSYSDLSELLFLFVEYAQLLAQTLLATFSLYPDTTLDSRTVQLKHLISPLSKAFDLSYLVGYGEYNSSVMIATSVVVVTVLTFIMGLLFYILKLVFTRQQGQKVLVELWRKTFNFNGRLNSFYTGSFLAGIFQLNQDWILDMDTGVKYLIYVGFWGVYVSLYLTAIVLIKYCTCILPTKSLFASKSTALEVLIQTQKMIMFLLVAFLPDNPSTNRWVYPIIGLIFDFLRLEYFFRVLPFYKSKALFIQVTFLAIPLALDIACFSQAILQAVNYSPNMNFLIVSWIILSVIGARAAQNYLKNVLLRNIINPKGSRPEILSHRVYLINELKRTNRKNNYSRFNWQQLLTTTINMNPKSLFTIDCNLTTLFGSKQAKNELYLKYLHSLLTQFPKNGFLTLSLAYLYAKKQKKYAIALKLLDELRTSPSYIIRCNAALLVDDVQEALRNEYECSDSKLNLFSYNKNLLSVVKLKKNIMKQCEFHISLYKEMNKSTPNLETLFNLAQDAHRYRSGASKTMKMIKETAPEYYLEPLALCAYYHLVFNHMIPEYFEYMRLFSQRYNKHEKAMKSPELCKENLYSKDVGIALVSGLRDKTGLVTYANKQFKNLCGKNPVHDFVYNMASPFLQPFWKQLPKTFAAYQGILTANPIKRMYFYSPGSGYIIPGGCFINIHPYIWKGQHYIYVFRPMPNPKEHIILSRNGDIQTFTEKIAKKLGLIPPTQPNSSSGTPIRQLCPELDEISRAYDLITQCAEGQIQENEEVIKARELYTLYSTTGGVLQVRKLKQNFEEKGDSDTEKHEFHCRIEVGGRGNITSKVITLEEIETKKKDLEILEEIPEKKISENADALTEDEIPSEGKPSFRANMDFIMTTRDRDIRDTSPLQLDSQSYLQTQIPKIPLQLLNQTLETEAIVTSSRQLVHNKALLVRQNEGNLSPKKSVFSPKKRADKEYSASNNRAKNINVDIDTQSVNSQRSGSSSQIGKMKAFNQLLTANLSPKKYRIFALLLLVLVMSLLILEGLMKFGLEKYITDLKSRKDVFSMTRMRDIRLMDIHRNTRYLWLLKTSLSNDDDIDVVFRTTIAVSRLGVYLQKLADADRNLRNAVNSLDDRTSKTMFQNNVKMYDTNYNDTQQTYLTLNTFDATSDIIAAVLQMIQFVKSNSSDTLPSFNFILRNIVNDILVQTQSAVNLLLTLLQDDRIKTQNFVLIITLIPSLLLVILMIVFIYLIKEFYLKEKHTMAAFAQLNVKEIATVQERISRFTKMIEDEIFFEDVPSVNISEFLYRRDTRNKLAATSISKAKNTSNYKGIRRKYIFTTVKLLVLMLCLLGVIGANLGLSFSVINSLETKVHHLQVATAMTEQVTLLGSILIDMVSVNDTTQVLDTTPSVLAIDTLDQVSTLKDGILDIFQASSPSQAAILKPLLFSDMCSILPNVGVRPACAFMVQGQNTTGFIQMATSVEFFVSDTRSEFLASNRSNDTLHEYQVDAFNVQVLEIVVVQDLAFLIWGAIDDDLDENIQKRHGQNTISFTILVVLLVVISILVERVILGKLRDTDNQLRRVLMTVPGNLILSNFILKSYLLKIAKGRLDFIRNEI